jgi:hypothetical protein
MNRQTAMRAKKLMLTGLTLVILLSIGITAAKSWRAQIVARMEREEYTRAARLLADGKSRDALALIDAQVRTDARVPWSKLELDSLTAAHHIPRLVSLYRRTPQRVLAHEEASLLVARACQAAGQTEELASIRKAWRGQEVHPELWLALDSDLLGLAGKTVEAEKLLLSKKFSGEAEATRLVRLALHAAKRDLYEAWTLLDQAFALAPRNPEIRSFRAQILESIGRTAEARVEYVAAHVADPKNPLLRDELAEFYRRQGSYDLALQTWREALPLDPPDFIILKEAFWSRVIQPSAKSRVKLEPEGSLVPLIEFIQALPQDRFWDAEAFNRLPQNHRYAQDRPEVFWLQLLETLRTGKEDLAAELLRENRFKVRSFRPELEAGLVQLLRFRAGKNPNNATALETGTEPKHPFWRELAREAHEPGSSAFLRSRSAIGAALLAAGWREAALSFSSQVADEHAPAWFVYGMAQSLRYNRGAQDALGYLPAASRTAELRLLRGELLLNEKRLDEGKAELNAVARNNFAAGYRAAWLLALAAVETGDLAEAKAIIQGQSQLANSTAGRELLARLSLMGGNKTEAEKRYRAIAKDSIEAQTFLARQAFERQEWAVARRYTEALMRALPDELQLRENLLAINQAEAAHEKR